MDVDDLYEQDFYAWTQQQADALRARGRGGNLLDYDRLAEEVADLGKSEFREVRSYTARIIEHLFRLAWSENEAPRDGWRSEIIQFRRELKGALTTSIRRKVEAELDDLHESAADAMELQFRQAEPSAPRDASLRWTLAQIFGEATLPDPQAPPLAGDAPNA